MNIKTLASAIIALVLFAPSVRADSAIDFSELVHGEIVNSQYLTSHGVGISAVNIGGGPDLALAFDASLNYTRDPDLEGPPWAMGNLAGSPDNDLERFLIIGENAWDWNGDGVIDYPDDEGSRPAGSLIFDFDDPIDSFGFDLVDIEGPSEYGDDSGYVAAFFMGGVEIGRVGFGEFINSASAFYDPTIVFGNNSANRIQPITAAELGGLEFDKVEVNLGGSGAVDNLTWSNPTSSQPQIPEPITASLVFLGVVGVASQLRQRLLG
jgi:hypothetical protein